MGYPKLPVVGNRQLSAPERLGIYANMYFYRIRDSLEDDFPSLVKLLGKGGFHNLVTDYLLAHPPSHWSLRYAGQHLAAFLKKHSLAKKWPFIISLAELEWALLTAFDAADAVPLSAAHLKKIPPAEWGRLKMGLVPSAQLVRSRFPIKTVRERLMKTGKTGVIDFMPTALVIWREGNRVMYRSCNLFEFRCLTAFRRGINFGEVCRRIAHDNSALPAAQKIFSALHRWVEDGLLIPHS